MLYLVRNKILKTGSGLLRHLRLIDKRSKCPWYRRLRLGRRERLDRHLSNVGILTLSPSLHFLLKFVLLSVLFKPFFIKSLRKINWFFFFRLCRLGCFHFGFLFLDRLSFSRFRFMFFNKLKLFFFDRLLDLFFRFRLAFNWLRFSNFCRLATEESAPIISGRLCLLRRCLLK